MSTSPLLTTREALPILRLSSLDGAIRHLRAAGLIPVRRGNALLWDRAQVLSLVSAEGRRHG